MTVGNTATHDCTQHSQDSHTESKVCRFQQQTWRKMDSWPRARLILDCWPLMRRSWPTTSRVI